MIKTFGIRKNKGITLISLVITIIIILILASITLSTLIGNGLLNKVKEAKKQAEIANIKEEISAGIFAFSCNTGEVHNSYSFRPVVIRAVN